MPYETFTGELDKPTTSGYSDFTGELDNGAEQMKKLGKMAGGALEAGASVLSGLPAQAVGGVRGLGALLSGQGLDRANQVLEDTTKSNFGLGAYTPYSDKGKQYSEQLGHALEIPGQKVGNVTGYIGNKLGGLISPEAAMRGENVGRTAGELATNTAMSLIDPMIGIKGAQALLNKGKSTAGLSPKEASAQRLTNKEDALDNIGKPSDKYTEFTGQLDEGSRGPVQPTPEPAPGPYAAYDAPQVKLDAAQTVLDNRQKAIEFEVSKQTSLDFNAAERARQENAPLPTRDVVAGEPAMQTRPDVVPEQNAVVPELPKTPDVPVEAHKPIDPAVANAQTLLDRQQAKLDAVKDKVAEGKAPTTDLITESRALQEAKADLEAAQKRNGDASPVLSPDVDVPLSPKDNGSSFNTRTRGQGGAVNFDAVAKGISETIDKLGDALKNVGLTKFDSERHASDYMSKNIPTFEKAVEGKFKVPDSPEQVIADVMKSGIKDTPPIWNAVQSGPGKAAAKWGFHPLLMSLSRNLNYAVAKGDFQVRQLVRPLEKYLSHLSTAEIIENNSLFKKEMLQDKKFTPEQLKDAGYSDKQINAYTMQRAAMDSAFELQNRNLKALGKPEISKENAYYSSQWHGDWHAPVLDKQGNLAWYIRTTTKAEGIKALEHLRTTMGDTLDIKKGARPDFRDTKINPNTPTDVIGAYQDMIGFFKDQPGVSTQIQEALQGYMQQKAFTVAGQDKHFLHKGNIRGFEGDRPWLDAKENAYAGSRSQLNYLTNSIKWSHMQEAIANSKQVMSNPDVIAKFPNALDYSKAVLAREMGIDTNVAKGIETALAQIMPASLNPIKMFSSDNYGVSRGTLFKAGANIKKMTYWQLLGFNPAYFVGTALQSVVTTPLTHSILSANGFKHNIAKTTALALGDSTAAIMSHLAHDLGKSTDKIPMTKIGREGLQYLEDAGVISRNAMDESKGLNENPGASHAVGVTNWTIGFPDKISRISSFMSLLHHLDASGKFPNKLDLFRKTAEMTDFAMTSFKPHDRPLVVDKFGVSGEMGYTFKSFLFDQFNSLSVAGRMAWRGNPKPLATMGGMLALMGGLYNLPVMNEMDMMWNTTKDLVANLKPDMYSKIQKVDNGLGIKGNLISLLPQTSGFRDLLGYGGPSAASGVQMSSRFGMGTGIDPAHPLQGVAPVLQEIKEMASIGKIALNPTNPDTWLSAIHTNSPQLAQGNMETGISNFKSGNSPGNQIYLKPNDLENPQATGHRRTEADETARKFGVKTLNEARDLETQYITNKESQRLKTAQDGLVSHIMSGIKRGDTDAITHSANEFLKLNPDSRVLDGEIRKGILAMNLTPNEQKMMYMKTISQIQNYSRFNKMNQ